MGKIILIVGSHGVGKTTLFNFAKQKGEFLVFDSIKIPTDGYDLQKRKDFLAYEDLYLKSINENNARIKQSNRNGLVVRSIEESSYYYHFYKDQSIVDDYNRDFANEANIKADKIIFLNASASVLRYRCQNDSFRDMVETTNWYRNEYTRYVNYWKNYPGVTIIETDDKTTDDVYREIKAIVDRGC